MEKPTTERTEPQLGRWAATLEAALRPQVRQLIESILEEEVEQAVKAGRGERVRERAGYRHGSKPRQLTLRSGTVELEVPRARLTGTAGEEREWQSELIPRYRRATAEVDQAVLGIYLSGGNTRRIRGALAPLLSGAPLSKSSVSRLVARLEETYQQWAGRDLSQEKMAVVYLDAIYPLLRNASRVIKQPVLVALGVRRDGEKVLLGMTTAGRESTDGWALLIQDLAARGLECPQLIASDGNKGLRAACAQVWGSLRHQRCTLHKLRNLIAKAPKHCLDELREDYRGIVYAESHAQAIQGRQRFLEKWRRKCPSVAASLEEAGDELLTFWSFPQALHESIRTTNIIERINQEFRRRVKTQGPLPSEGAVLRLFFGLLISGNLRMRRVRGFRELNGQAMVA
jgi:transposase-like protein